MDPAWIIGLSILFGLLAFFEPCAIASNVLFTQYVQRISPRERAGQLAGLLAGRVTLLVALGVTVSVAARTWGVVLQELFLPIAYASFGVVYVASRFVYIPVPHIRFHGIIPGGEQRLDEGTKVGLTLPACTIPLTGALLMALVGEARPVLGAVTMLLFAIFFTIPAFIYSYRPATPASLRFLDRSARVTPYLTGVLFAVVAAGMILTA